MVLPFQPFAMTFQDICYYVDTPPVIFFQVSKISELTITISTIHMYIIIEWVLNFYFPSK